ncbi:MAG TPA: DsbA family protein [Candidatus Acidoferrales bacterium]|nr:DsbA family protein [Candidatus Acidoferrales bacterium]
MSRVVELIAYSDYLCPWCYNGTVRLRRVEEEFGDQLVVDWRSFLLRPKPDPRRTLEKFREYTRSWLRPAAETDSGTFHVWESAAGPPSHSIPPHLVAKAAAAVNCRAFRDIHERLMRAYFTDNRDITDWETLRAIWNEADLPAAAFEHSSDPALLRVVLAEHEEAIELGITGVPTVCMKGRDGFVIGAQPVELYRRWIHKVQQEST